MNNSKQIDEELGKDFVSLFSGRDKNDIPQFMKLFWEVQQKFIQTSKPRSDLLPGERQH